MARAAVDYLGRWRHAFELFGDGQRFLQLPILKQPPTKRDVEDDEGGSLTSKLDVALATGNNSTLFDNAGGAARDFAPTQLALMLLTFQCFSPSGRIGVAVWDGKQTPGNGSSSHAPCLADGMLHTLLRGDNLLTALHRNLLNKMQSGQLLGQECWGGPIWEFMPRSPGDAKAARNATQTYLGRLVPLARAIWLATDGRFLILANGLEYASYKQGWREPSATIVTRTVKGRQTREVLRASTTRAVWRELHALTVKAIGEKPGGPATLGNISEDEEAFDLWVGGLVATWAKLIDTAESVFHIPKAMLGEPSQRVYEDGVRHAETMELRLGRAVSVYRNELGDKVDRPEMKDRSRQVQRTAATQFWTDVEQAVPRLLEVAAEPASPGLKHEWHKTTWGKTVWSAAREAYERACPHETPRQIRAYALGLHSLFVAPSSGAPVEIEGEPEA
jgi:CRISPR system Cascade subunit CasA